MTTLKQIRKDGPISAKQLLKQYSTKNNWSKVTIIIPAYNEAKTIATVIKVAKTANANRLLVVDNNSGDDTTEVSKAAGAEVLFCETQGKAEAMRMGVEASKTDIVMFLDADLTGLTKQHLEALLTPFFIDGIKPSNIMTMGTFDRGEKDNLRNWRFLPFLTGQRALLKSTYLDAVQNMRVKNWEIEGTLNAYFADEELPQYPMVFTGLFHRLKEDKYGKRVGMVIKIGMISIALFSYLKFPFKKMLRFFRR